jgi:hypothetical protein
MQYGDPVGGCEAARVEQSLSALIVPVPEAEPVVGRLRAELDPSAALGVGAHVTVMVPFVPPSALDGAATAAVREIVAAHPAFDVVFRRVEWFGETSVWLAPEPAAPFVALTEAVRSRFGLDPYAGEHGPGVTPHLTVGHKAPLPRLRAAVDHVAGRLPLRARARTLWLAVGSKRPGSWTTVTEFALPDGNRSG